MQQTKPEPNGASQLIPSVGQTLTMEGWVAMRVSSLTLLLTCGVVIGATADAVAQIGYLWTYDEMLQKADIVVVGKCVATLDTGRQSGVEPAFPVVEMRTKLRVQATLKAHGQTGVGVCMSLRHYRRDMERWRKAHPPEPGRPPPGVMGAPGELTFLEGDSYLMFLKQSADGVYEPLSGHTVPTDSVLRLETWPNSVLRRDTQVCVNP